MILLLHLLLCSLFICFCWKLAKIRPSQEFVERFILTIMSLGLWILCIFLLYFVIIEASNKSCRVLSNFLNNFNTVSKQYCSLQNKTNVEQIRPQMCLTRLTPSPPPIFIVKFQCKISPECMHFHILPIFPHFSTLSYKMSLIQTPMIISGK